MIEALWVMTYFKISLPTRNWDIAFFLGAPGMARSAVTGAICWLWWSTDDLEVQVLYTPGKGKC